MLKKKVLLLLRKKQNTNLFIYGFGQVFNLITPLLVIPYIVSICGVENYGKIGVGMALSFFLIVFIDYGSDIIGVKEVSVNRDNLKELEKIFITTYTAKFILLLTLLSILSALFIFIPYFKEERSLFFLGLPILVGQFINPIWFLQGVENFKWITILNISSKTIYLLAVFVFIQKPEDYIYVNLLWGVGMILPFSLGVLKCAKNNNISFEGLKFSNVTDFIKENFKFLVSQLFLSLKNYSPIVLISFLGGYTIAGQYKIIEQIIMPFRTYLQVVFRFFYPKLCYEIYNDKAKGILYWKKINSINLILILIMLSIVFIFSSEILIFFKVEQTNLLILSKILKYSLLVPLFITISFTLEQLLFSLGKNSTYIKITIFSVIINFIIMFVLFRKFELYGLISSLLVTEMMVISLYVLFIKIILKPNNSK